MTLRDLLTKAECDIRCPHILYDIEFASNEDIPIDDLRKYFKSSNFQNDVFCVMSKIHDTKKEIPDCNFSLFFRADLNGSYEDPLKLDVFPLIG